MIIKKNRDLERIDAKLILSLEENGYFRDYYQIFSSSGMYFFLLNEFSSTWQPDYFIVFFNWQYLVDNLNRCESKLWLPIKNKWWSYCPPWVYLNVKFIKNNFRPLINYELYKLLDGVFETDLSDTEKIRFQYWMKACEAETFQLNLFP